MSALRQEAAPFEAFVAGLGPREVRDLHRLADELSLRLRRFSQICDAKGTPRVQLGPARLALAAIADQKVRSLRATDLTVWTALSRQTLFEGRDVSTTEIREFHRVAQAHGADFADLSDFLDDVLGKLSTQKQRKRRKGGFGWAIATVLVLGVVGMAGYLAWLESRFHAQALAAFSEFEATLPLDGNGQSSVVVQSLGVLSADIAHVEKAVIQAPLRGVVTLPFADAVGDAQAQYSAAAGRAIGPLLGDVIGLALATEGQALALYDSLRAYGILSGQTDWEPEFLAGWIAAREANYGLDGFAAHVASLTGPLADMRKIDPVVLAQAQEFAAETSEADRAWLEMLRAPDIVAFAPWRAEDAVPGLADIATRRSGKPLHMAGLYTQAGWAVARDVAAGVAVTKSRNLALILFGTALPQENDTPDQVMARLQTETVGAWKDWLSDLRVLPFDVPERAIIVSGVLSQTSSPLPRLFTAIWEQVGGNDRTRPRPYQTEVARAFGPAIQYVEQGRMDEIAALFATVNVALVTLDLDSARGNRAIVSAAERVRSIQSLRAAPRLVVQIVEDTLAQISAPEVSVDNPMARAWLPSRALCSAELVGRYPFGAGPPVSVETLTKVLGPSGAIPQFFGRFAAPNMELGESPWRWKTEARFTGLTPESAVFFERAMAISSALFDEAEFGATMTVAALAERGQASLMLGGQTASVRANAAPSALRWPGPVPEQGIALQFGAVAADPSLTRVGPWGMLQLLDTMRLRPREDGERFLIDMRGDGGRVFVELLFEEALNPLALRSAMEGFGCPDEL